MTAAGVRISRLGVEFDTRAGVASALRDVDLDIGPGRILGLVGESGSGKSTAALALLGLLAANARVSTGSLSVGGDSYDLTVPGATMPLRGRRIAMIFQDPFGSLNPVFPIRAHLDEVLNLAEVAAPAQLRRRQMVEALAAVGIDQPELRLRQYPHELSGGMRQRVAIAMALLARPRLLIADEPTTALDATVEAQVMRELLKLREAIGCSVLLITHSLGIVAQYCDDVAVLYAGELIERGSVAAVTANPRHPYTRALLACEVAIDTPMAASARDNHFRVIAGDLPDPLQRPPGCIFAARCDRVIAECHGKVPPPVEISDSPLHVAHCLRADQ